MRNCTRLAAGLLSFVAVVVCSGVYSRGRAEAATRPQEPDVLYGPSFAFLAWDLFVKAMAPVNGSLTFESWTEQCQLNPDMVGCPSAASVAAPTAPASRKVRLLHGSVFSAARKIAGNNCGAMTATPVGGYPPPANLTRNAVYCEEVFVNPVEASFVKRNLTTLVAQQSYGRARNGTINFPGTGVNDSRLELDSVEVKADWVPASSYKNPSFACPDPTNRLYTEMINGTCYALAAVHISSKVMPNWLWATFEPNSDITNPNRCDPKLYGACFDPWGTTSSQPYGKGQRVQQSAELRQAMADAHLNPAFQNYFLTGVQTEFVDHDGRPTLLGNSFIEFNQGVAPGKSS